MIRLDNIVKDVLLGAAAQPAVKKLEKAAEGFEKVFLKDLISAMRKTTATFSDESYTTGMYRDMLDDAFAEAAAKKGSFGISQEIMHTMKPHVLRGEMERLKNELRAGTLKLPNAKFDIKS